MKMSTKIWLILAIIGNIGLIYFFTALIHTIQYTGGQIYFNFTTEAYLGLAFFILANIAGTIVIVRFLKTQSLGKQIFFSITPITISFMAIVLFFLTIDTVKQTNLTVAVRIGLRIVNQTSQYIWVGIVGLIYMIYIAFICTIITKPLRKIERSVELLKYGKVKKPIRIGESKQFKNIENDLNAINDNYKDSNKIIKQIDPAIMKEAMEDANLKSPEINSLVVSTYK